MNINFSKNKIEKDSKNNCVLCDTSPASPRRYLAVRLLLLLTGTEGWRWFLPAYWSLARLELKSFFSS
jgi:hypothetical protein